jgi:hypothetical protein
MVEAVVPMLVTAIPVLLVEGLVQMPATVVLVEREMSRLPHQHREIVEEPLLILPPSRGGGGGGGAGAVGNNGTGSGGGNGGAGVASFKLPEVLLLTLVAVVAVPWMEARVQVVPVVVETVTKD